MLNKDVEFFVVAQPGLEDLVEAEVRDWYPQLHLERQHGGVTFHAPLVTGLEMNLCLRTATRILARVSSFRCRDFPKLFKNVSNLDWSQWIQPEATLRVHASTRMSRLKIKRRIEETCEDAWFAYQKQKGVKAIGQRKADLYVRFHDDICTLSLDTSGERLHKRGEKPLVGEAPLRESIAAALIQWVGREYGRGEAEVVDPMMGSGTFLSEAAHRDQCMDSRTFAFEQFVIQPGQPPRRDLQRPTITKLIGFEQDAKTLKAAKSNLGSLRVDVHQADFLIAEPLPAAVRPRWIFANPPYGERLAIQEPLPQYYEKLFSACERVAHPDLSCFILPSKAVKGKFSLPPGWRVLNKRPFLNGGIPVTAFVFGRS